MHIEEWSKIIWTRYNAYRAGLKKHKLNLDNEQNTSFSYYEKGSRVKGVPTIIFVHGLSSNKETFILIIQVRKYILTVEKFNRIAHFIFQNIPDHYHTITLDLPGHGETKILCKNGYSIEIFADYLKLVSETEWKCAVSSRTRWFVILNKHKQWKCLHTLCHDATTLFL